MKKITTTLLLSVLIISSLTKCESKKTVEGKRDVSEETSPVSNTDKEQLTEEKQDVDSKIPRFSSYNFAEKLKNDNFFNSENTNKTIEINGIGVTSYLIVNNKVTLYGIFYDKEKNIAIPRYNNNPPNSSFVTEYYDKLEMKYDEKYKKTYSAVITIILKDPKLVKKLKMYLPNETSRSYEYQINTGNEPQYRSGFIDLITVKGTFKGESDASEYPDKVYEITDAEII